MPDERGYSKCTHCWGEHHVSEWRMRGEVCPVRYAKFKRDVGWFMFLVVSLIVAWFSIGCRSLAVSRALYGGGPPFHVAHPDRDDDLWCDRYHHLLPGVTIDEALDRAREIDDCKRAHGGMP